MMNFDTLPYIEKRRICLIILSGVKEYDEFFHTLYAKVDNGAASDVLLNNIYLSAKGLRDNQHKEKLQDQTDILINMKKLIKERLLKEKEQSGTDRAMAETLLSNI